jgi:catechol 2,3-dioxygenase-like lactoylglutathione lyase family enzyme
MTTRPRLVGINHVALEVGDLEEALSFYGGIFELELRGRVPGMAFHLGLVVDDKEAVRAALQGAGAEILPSRGLDFRDPWGNHIQVVQYGDIQFTKATRVLQGMGLEDLEKSPQALRELREKGLD